MENAIRASQHLAGESQTGIRSPANHRRARIGAIVAGAAALGGLALWNTNRARKAEREHPPMGRFITAGNVRLHFLERGQGQPVVLLHGNIVTAEDFRLSGLFGLLADEGYRVVAFDRPGFGFSDRPRGHNATAGDQAAIFREAFARLGIERPIVVGHSWGAHVALALALGFPEAIGGIVVLSGDYYPTVRADVPLASISAIPILGDVLRYTLSPLLTAASLPAACKLMFSPNPVPGRFANGFPASLSTRPWQIRAEAQDSASMIPAAAEMQHRYQDIDLPVVIMAGAEDRIVDVDRHAVRLHRQVPLSKIKLIPNAGHMVHYAAPEEMAGAIGDMVSGLGFAPPTGLGADRHSGLRP